MIVPMQSAELTMIIPVFNEMNAVRACFQELQQALEPLKTRCAMVFVDDGSCDGTAQALSRAGCDYVRHEVNQGYGAAIKTGARASTSRWIGIIDCDHSYPASEVANLLGYAEQCDMVVGARDPALNPWRNRLAKRLSCGLLSAIFPQPVLDINSGFRIIDRKVFLHYAPAICDRFSLTSSITLGFLLDRRKIQYVPIPYRTRVGRSKVRAWSYTRDFIRALQTMHRFCRAEASTRTLSTATAKDPE
jgi:glycosyltransferase involved in cell wall biosynthesis